jgi:hypothetical protein
MQRVLDLARLISEDEPDGLVARVAALEQRQAAYEAQQQRRRYVLQTRQRLQAAAAAIETAQRSEQDWDQAEQAYTKADMLVQGLVQDMDELRDSRLISQMQEAIVGCRATLVDRMVISVAGLFRDDQASLPKGLYARCERLECMDLVFKQPFEDIAAKKVRPISDDDRPGLVMLDEWAAVLTRLSDRLVLSEAPVSFVRVLLPRLDCEWTERHLNGSVPSRFEEVASYKTLVLEHVKKLQQMQLDDNQWLTALQEYAEQMEHTFIQLRIERALFAANTIFMSTDFGHRLVVEEAKDDIAKDLRTHNVSIPDAYASMSTDWYRAYGADYQRTSPFVFPTSRVSNKIHQFTDVLRAVFEEALALPSTEDRDAMLKGALRLVDLYCYIIDDVQREHGLDGILLQRMLLCNDAMFLAHRLLILAATLALSDMKSVTHMYLNVAVVLQRRAHSKLQSAYQLVKKEFQETLSSGVEGTFRNAQHPQKRQDIERTLKQLEHQLKHTFKSLKPLVPPSLLLIFISALLEAIGHLIMDYVDDLGDMEEDECFAMHRLLMQHVNLLPTKGSMGEVKDEAHVGFLGRLHTWFQAECNVLLGRSGATSMAKPVLPLVFQRSLRFVEILDLTLSDILERFNEGVYQEVDMDLPYELVRRIQCLFVDSEVRRKAIAHIEGIQ